MAKALPILWVDDGNAFGRRLLPWKPLSKGPLLLRGVFSSWVYNLDLLVRRWQRQWRRAPPWRCCLEGCALSVYGGGQCRSKEGGDLAEDSRYQCPRWWKAVKMSVLTQ